MKNNYVGKGLASIALAIVCTTSIYISGGETGVGWFVLGLFIIWGS